MEERDRAAAERDAAIAERDLLIAERDQPLREEVGNDFRWILNRKPSANSFDLQCSSIPERPDDIALVVRIIAAYRRAYAEYEKSASGWDHDLWEMKRDIHEQLLDGSPDRVASLLRDPASTTLFWGFDAVAKAPPNTVEPHELVLRRLDGTTDWRTLYAVWIMDAVRSLGEAVGAIRIAYPEIDPQSEVIPTALMTVDPILEAIEATLRCRIDFPNPFADELGLSSTRGIIGFRAVQAIYQAWRATGVARNRPDFRMLEIGAGLGRTAYYAAKMGIRDYTIIDIPLTNVAQAYFLGRTLGENAISLHGEPPTTTGVKIVSASAHALRDLKEQFDLILNVDSMTELSTEDAQAYYDFAKQRAEMFISVNHEFNPVTVHSLYDQDKDVAACRHPYWMRRGYVEEIITWPKG